MRKSRTYDKCKATALACVVYGFGAIPAEWTKALRGKGIIESCLF